MQTKEDYKHMRVQLDSMRLCTELDAKHAMMDNDVDAYYALCAEPGNQHMHPPR